MTPANPHPIRSGPVQRAVRSDGLRGSAAQAGHPHPPQAVEGEFAVGSSLVTGVIATDREDWK